MNPNRKTDLQRRLANMPAPAPPPELAERIKREIPRDLRFEPRSRSAVTLRLAASILVAALGVYVMFRVLPRNPLPYDAPPPRAFPRTPAAAAEQASPPPALKPQPAAAKNVARRDEAAPAAVPAPAMAKTAPESESQLAETAAADRITVAPARAAAAAPAAGGLAKMARAEPAARFVVEATVSPVSGKTILRVQAPEGKVVVDGAQRIGADLYVISGETATVHVAFGQETFDRTISPVDVRPWSEASPQMKDAVQKAEGRQ